MINFQRENESFVRRLRVRGANLEPVSARLNLERLLSPDNLAPAGIPARAIVCLRKLPDPLPGALRLNNDDLKIAGIWRAAVAREIENHYRRAFRPIRETVPAAAESVLFADRAEFLACLALDFCHGTLTEKWWWRAIFPKPGEAEKIAQIWLASAEFAPPAFDLLARKGAAIAFLRKLEPPEVKEMLIKIARLFGLKKLESVLFQGQPKSPPHETTNFVVAPSDRRVLTPEDRRQESEIERRIGSLLPEIAAPPSGAVRQICAETILLLARAPALARSAEYAARAKIILIEESFRRVNLVTENTARKPVKKNVRTFPVPKKVRAADSAQTVAESPPGEQKELEKSGFSGKNERPKFKRGARADRKKSADQNSEAPPAEHKFTEKKFNGRGVKFEDFVPVVEAKTAAKGTKKALSPRGNEPARQAKDVYWEDENAPAYVFYTGFGGVFYLLNLALYLELYRDFTESETDELDLPIWDFLALTALEMIGQGVKSDPLWDFLQSCAGGDQGFGGETARFRDWRIEPSWLKTFSPDSKWLYRTTKKRLVVRHDAGFNVIDVARTGDSVSAQLAGEMAVYEQFCAELVKGERSSLKDLKPRKWIENFAEFLEKRLFQALLIENAEELNRILFERSATVEMTATHLEITFSLADLPFEVRAAGIDRDPGWIPAAGRFVYFHYV